MGEALSATHSDGEPKTSLQLPLKIFSIVFGIGWLLLGTIRFLVLPNAAAGTSMAVLSAPTLNVLLIILAWSRASGPGFFWQYSITLLALLQVAWLAYIAGATVLWQLPLAAGLCALLIVYLEQERHAARRVLGLSAKQWMLFVALAAAIITIGLIAFFSRQGPEREMHIVMRSIFIALNVMLAWLSAILYISRGGDIEKYRKAFLKIGVVLYFIIFNYIIIVFNDVFNKYSIVSINQFFYKQSIWLNAGYIFFIFFLVTKSPIRWRSLAILGLALIWAILISRANAVAAIPALHFMALLPFAVRFRNALSAASYWAVLLGIILTKLPLTDPFVLMHCMSGSLVFAGSFWICRYLERDGHDSASHRFARGVSADGYNWIFSDRRSILIGLSAASIVMLVGSALVYMERANKREIAKFHSRAVAERLEDRLRQQFRISEQVSESIALRLQKENLSEAELNAALIEILPILSRGQVIEWAPNGVIKTIVPQKGYESIIGLNILAMASQRNEAIHAIQSGVPHWTGPLNLANRKKSGLIYRVPVYRSNEAPSSASFIGLVQIVIDLNEFFSGATQYDLEDFGLRIWIKNASKVADNRQWQRVWDSNGAFENLPDLHYVTEFAAGAEEDGDTLNVRIESYPRRADLLENMPAQFQAILMLAIVIASAAAWADHIMRRSALAQGQLRDSEAFRGALIQGAGAAVIATDPRGVITLFNPAAEALLGYRADEVVNKVTPVLFHDPDELEAKARTLMRELGRDFDPDFNVFLEKSKHAPDNTSEWTYIRKDGSRVPVLLSQNAIRNDEGEITAFLGIARDITSLKAADRARAQFIANISHELRTPLNAVLGYARLLEQAPLSGEDKERLKRLGQASQMLFSLVNDVLDWSKIEAGEIDIVNEPFSLTDRCETLMAIMEEQATRKGLQLNCKKQSDLPTNVIGDATRFQQIMFNLIGNAIKFTESGEIVITVQQLATERPGRVRLRFDVRDTGIGIPPEDQKHLFERFRQVQEGSTRQYHGTGLGLAIVKELAELMDGNVSVKSTPGEGSTFSVELEFAQYTAPELPEDELSDAVHTADAPLTGKRILLVDDSDLVIELTEWILKDAGAQVWTCTNGQEALDWLEAHDAPDIILMDVQMPVLDGNATVSIMRTNEAFRDLPVIAMTAGATKTNITDAMNAGMTDCITKPFTPEILLQALLKHID